tara:strand:- start:8505 stop:9419 length:915 start_codon:yes stop_codon:yes gene_type:complete
MNVTFNLVRPKIKILALFYGICVSSSLALASSNYPSKAIKDSLVAIMSFNIRNSNAKDGSNDWEHRKKWVGDLIHFYKPGIIGMQEVLHDQLLYIESKLSQYGHIGIGRNDGGTKGEYSPIFYNKARYKLIEKATFWLSESPEKPSISWGAATYRIVTWGKFKDKVTEESFFIFNTHFDNRENAREKSAKLLLEKVHHIAGRSQAIVIGDFNSKNESQTYQILTVSNKKNKGLFDTAKLAKNKYGPDWTFHSFGSVPVKNRERIDYIFSNKKVKVKQYVSISEQRGNLFPSDHLPILAHIQLKE